MRNAHNKRRIAKSVGYMTGGYDKHGKFIWSREVQGCPFHLASWKTWNAQVTWLSSFI